MPPPPHVHKLLTGPSYCVAGATKFLAVAAASSAGGGANPFYLSIKACGGGAPHFLAFTSLRRRRRRNARTENRWVPGWEEVDWSGCRWEFIRKEHYYKRTLSVFAVFFQISFRLFTENVSGSEYLPTCTSERLGYRLSDTALSVLTHPSRAPETEREKRMQYA